MGHYKQGEFDFVKRTLKILKQYEHLDFDKLESEKYEVTLCMNCLMGLIVIPQQNWIKDIPQIRLGKSWHLKEKHILYEQKSNLRLDNIVRHLRNSISHGKLNPISKNKGKNRNITHLKFKDFNEDKELTFEALIPVNTLKNFALKFAKEMIRLMKQE